MPKKLSKKEQLRQERLALHEQRDTMTANQREGYVRRWVNEENIEKRKAVGWEVVEDEVQVGEDKDGNSSIGTGAQKQAGIDKRTGNPYYAILMEIQQELYDIDQEIKQENNNEVMNSINKDDNSQGRYSKLEGRND